MFYSQNVKLAFCWYIQKSVVCFAPFSVAFRYFLLLNHLRAGDIFTRWLENIYVHVNSTHALYDWELHMTAGYGIKGSRNSETESDSFRNAFQSLANSNSKAILYGSWHIVCVFSVIICVCVCVCLCGVCVYKRFFRQRFLRNYYTYYFEIWYKGWVWLVVLCKREPASSCLSFPLFVHCFLSNQMPKCSNFRYVLRVAQFILGKTTKTLRFVFAYFFQFFFYLSLRNYCV